MKRITSLTFANGAGIEFPDGELRPVARLALTALFWIPPRLRESLLFGKSNLAPRLQKVLIRLLGGASLVQTKFTNGPMRGQLFVCWTSEKYFLLGPNFESGVQQLLLKIIQPGEVIYDIGGHAGYMSLLLASASGSAARIFTFEPSPINFARIRRNVEANGHTNITVINAAASDREGAALLDERGSQSAIVKAPSASAGEISRIRTMRLDDFAYRDGNPPPTFIKIDIEGHAGPALEGMRRIIESTRPRILCELHHGQEQAHFTRIVSAYRYRIQAIEREQGFPRQVLAIGE